MKDNILITGGYGFIGSHLVNLVYEQFQDADIYVIDSMTYAANVNHIPVPIRNSSRFHSVNIDIANSGDIARFFKDTGFLYIFHLAAESHVDNSIKTPDIFLETNIIGTHNLLKQALIQHKNNDKFRFLHISTDEVYGSLKPTEPAFKETNKYFPNSPYSASKASSDHLVRAYGETYGLPVLISNCSNNYGPYQHDEKLIPTVVRALMQKQPIPVYGTGENIRDWIYAEDHAQALIEIITKSELGETYNVGADKEFTNLELIHKIIEIFAEITGESQSELTELISFVTDRLGHDFRYAMDSSKIKDKLGWVANTSLPDGLKKTIDFYIQKYS